MSMSKVKAGDIVRCKGCPAKLRITVDGTEPICSSCKGKIEAESMCPKCYCEGGIQLAVETHKGHGNSTPLCTYCGWWLRLKRFGDGDYINHGRLESTYLKHRKKNAK